jgi:hypothetical protein
MLSTDIKKPFLPAAPPEPFDETEVVAIAIPPPSDSVRLPSTLIRSGRPVQFWMRWSSGTGTEVPVYTATHEVEGGSLGIVHLTRKQNLSRVGGTQARALC